MRRFLIFFLVVVCFAFLYGCGNKKLLDMDDDYVIHYEGHYYIPYDLSVTGYTPVYSNPIIIGTYRNIYLARNNVYVSEYDQEQNLLFDQTSGWIWYRDDFEFPNFLSLIIYKIYAREAYTIDMTAYPNTVLIWESDDDSVAMSDILDESKYLSDYDDLSGFLMFECDFTSIEFPYLQLEGVGVYVHENSQAYMHFVYYNDESPYFLHKYYAVKDEYVQLFVDAAIGNTTR